jgi:hypothetical protein
MIERLENRALLSATVTQTFKIDSALSFATGSGVLTLPSAVDANGNPVGADQKVSIKAQTKGSLTNHASGTIRVATSSSSVRFVSAAIEAGNAGGAATPGGTPANFAGVASFSASSPTGTESGTVYMDIRNLLASLVSSTLKLRKGKFSNKSESFGISAGDLGVYVKTKVNGQTGTLGPTTTPLTNYATSAANLTTLTSTLVVDKKGKETLTIFASGKITESFGDISATLSLSGEIVATAQK